MFGRFNLNPYEFHKHLINEYVLKKPGNTALLKRDETKGNMNHFLSKFSLNFCIS